MVESGQTLSGAFLEAGLVDELVMFYAGSFDAPLPFENRFEYRVKDVQMVNKDVRVDAVNEHSLEQIS